MRAIIFEYEQDLEELLGYLVSKEGFTFEAVESPGDLDTLALARSPELLLLGTCPPHQVQLDVAQQLRHLHPDSFLLVLSTNRSVCSDIRQLNDPLFECLEAPFPPKILRSTLQGIREFLGTIQDS